MSSSAIQDFNQKFVQSPELQQKIGEVESVPQMLALLQAWECNLTAPDLITLAQQAYQTWLASLDLTVRPFFVEAHENKTLRRLHINKIPDKKQLGKILPLVRGGAVGGGVFGR